MKRTGSLLLSALICLILLPAAGQGKTVIRFAHGNNPGEYDDVYNHFASEVSRLSQGEMEVQIFPHGTICKGGPDCFRLVSSGEMEMSANGTSAMGNTLDSTFYLFDFPFIWDENRLPAYRESMSVGPLHDYMNTVFNKYGMEHVFHLDSGLRSFCFTNIDAKSLADVKGAKVRSTVSQVDVKALELFGMIPCPMVPADLVVALQQKTVDGETASLGDFMMQKRHELEKFILLTNHNSSPIEGFINKKFYDSLSSEQKKVLFDACRAAELKQVEELTQRTSLTNAYFAEHGVTVNPLTPENRAEFVKAAEPLFEIYKDKLDPAFVEIFLNTGK